MTVKQAAEYARRNPNWRPVDCVIASAQPIPLNEVFFHLGFRFRVERELTREEFHEQHRKNLQHPDYTRGNAEIVQSKVIPADDEAAAPRPDQKYFYALGRI